MEYKFQQFLEEKVQKHTQKTGDIATQLLRIADALEKLVAMQQQPEVEPEQKQTRRSTKKAETEEA